MGRPRHDIFIIFIHTATIKKRKTRTRAHEARRGCVAVATVSRYHILTPWPESTGRSGTRARPAWRSLPDWCWHFLWVPEQTARRGLVRNGALLSGVQRLKTRVDRRRYCILVVPEETWRTPPTTTTCFSLHGGRRGWPHLCKNLHFNEPVGPFSVSVKKKI